MRRRLRTREPSDDVDIVPERRPDEPMGARVVRSMKWSAVSRICIQLVQFGAQIALARILTPSDFGYAAIALLVANFALLLSDLGIGAALIHGADLSQRRVDTAFWINALLGVLLAALVVSAAEPLAQLLHQPAAVGPLRLSALTCAVAVYAVPLALLERRMELRLAGAIEAGAALTGAAVGVTGALIGFGAYAIVAVPLVTALCSSVLYLAGTRYRPRGFLDAAEAKSIWRYVRGLVGFNTINYFTRNTDNLLIGRFGTTAELGYYSRAFSLMLLPVSQVQTVIGRVLFPALARLREDLPRLRVAHRRTLLLSAMACAPLSVGAAATSHDLVLVLFGPAWAPMAPMLAILSVTGVQQVYQGTVGALFQATGQTDRMFRWNILFTALTISAFLIGIHWGAIGICWAVFIRGWALLPLTLAIPLHIIGERLSRVLMLLAPLSACLVLEGAAAYGAQLVLTPHVDSALLRLAVEVLIGGVVFLAAIWTLQRSASRDFVALLRRGGGGSE